MERTKDEIAAISSSYLKEIHLGDIFVTLDTSYIECREFAWHVGVRPSRYPTRMYHLYDELAAVAEEISEKEGVNLFFVVGEPILPDATLVTV